MPFKQASRKRVKARLAIGGMSKSGKSYTSLGIMRGIVGPEGRIAAVDTENGGLSLYAGTKVAGDFDVQVLGHFSPDTYIRAIDEAIAGKYDGLLIDSLSHEWMGSGGILEMVDGAPAGDKFFSGWKNATPKHNEFVRRLIAAPFHLIVTLRQKDDYVIETVNGKNTPVKIGTELIQRKGTEYEFNVVATMDLNHTFRVQHSCIDFLPNGTVIERPDGIDLGTNIRKWLDQGDEDWQPPIFKKAFYVNDREVVSAGIDRETYVRISNAGVVLDKLTKSGTSKALLGKKLADLSQNEGEQALAMLNEAVETAEKVNVDKQAKSA